MERRASPHLHWVWVRPLGRARPANRDANERIINKIILPSPPQPDFKRNNRRMIYWWEKAFLLAVVALGSPSSSLFSGSRMTTKKKLRQKGEEILNGDDTWISEKSESHLVCMVKNEEKNPKRERREDHKDVFMGIARRRCDSNNLNIQIRVGIKSEGYVEPFDTSLAPCERERRENANPINSSN